MKWKHDKKIINTSLYYNISFPFPIFIPPPFYSTFHFTPIANFLSPQKSVVVTNDSRRKLPKHICRVLVVRVGAERRADHGASEDAGGTPFGAVETSGVSGGSWEAGSVGFDEGERVLRPERRTVLGACGHAGLCLGRVGRGEMTCSVPTALLQVPFRRKVSVWGIEDRKADDSRS